MRILSIIGGIFVFIGAIWLLQGLDVLKGSVMTGQRQWALAGAVAAVVGAALIAWDIRRNRTG